MNSYKILSIILAALVVIAGGFYAYEKYKHSSTRVQLNNEIAKLEGTVQETETAYSRRGIVLSDLRSDNKELQQIIEDRDEEVLALGQMAFKWKDKYFKIKNAQQSIVPVSLPQQDGNESIVIEIPADCEAFFLENRLRVDFEHQEDPFNIKGFTLTNPPEAELKLEWTRDLKLSLILTKNEDDSFRLYVDPKTSDVGKVDLLLNVDPEILDMKWYEKIGIGLDLGVGEGVTTGVRIYYDILDNLSIGPNVVIVFDGTQAKVYYGVTVGFYPFRF